MSVQQTTGIRELSGQELDQVTGGLSYDRFESAWVVGVSAILAGAVIGVAARIWSWLTD
jgi:hypothetical protein